MSRWSPRPPRTSSTPRRNSRPPAMRTLYTFFRSSTSYRLRIALSLKGLDWEQRYVSLPKMEHREQAYLDVNPQGLVPALVEDGHVLAQSLAIIEYLDEAYPEPPFLPKDALRAGLCAAAQPDHRLRHPPAQQRPRAQVARGQRPRRRGHRRPLVRATGSPRAFAASRPASSSEARHGTYCLGDQTHHGRHLPRAAGRQCPTLQLRPLGRFR